MLMEIDADMMAVHRFRAAGMIATAQYLYLG
jgi:hypothetical protein